MSKGVPFISKNLIKTTYLKMKELKQLPKKYLSQKERGELDLANPGADDEGSDYSDSEYDIVYRVAEGLEVDYRFTAEDVKGFPESLSDCRDEHPLKLTFEPYRVTSDTTTYICDSCREEGAGYSYHCPQHKFDIHPGCSCELPTPALFNDPRHRHTLKILKWPEGEYSSVMCRACGEDYGIWFYYCSACKFGFHPKCVLGDGSGEIKEKKVGDHKGAESDEEERTQGIDAATLEQVQLTSLLHLMIASYL